MRTVDEWKTLLRTALRDAQRGRDGEAMAVLREALATIDNAEAPDVSHAPSGDTGPIAGAVQGLGAGEIARRVLGLRGGCPCFASRASTRMRCSFGPEVDGARSTRL